MFSSPHNFQNHPPRQRKRRFLLWFLAVMLILGMVFFASIAIAYKFYSTSRKVIIQNAPTSFLDSLKDITSGQQKPLRGESEGRINILLLGLAGENYPGENLTDSIIIASVNPQTYQTAMLSIPRDLYVQIPNTSSYTKINALYTRGQEKTAEGIDDLKKALTDITGLPIHYYIAIDFDGFKKIIDELGGIKIQVPKDIHDDHYPGPNYSYETFDIQKGLYNLDGETALKYARTRHDEDGDFGRAFRQQQILEAARSKAFSINTLLNIPAINNILDTLGSHLRTDISLDEIGSFLDLVKKIDTHTTINKVLDSGKPDSLLAVSHIFLGNVRAFILIPRTGKYDEIQELAKDIFNLETIERKKKEIASEEAVVAVVNASGVNGFDKKIAVLLQKMGYSNFVEVKPLRTEKESIIYDISQTKPFSLEDLAKKFSAKTSQNPPAYLSAQCQKANLCLVAGSDLIENLNYEENTVEDLEQGYDKQAADEREYIELLKKGSHQKF
jgi:LCP family protein required for cell wall assembly